MARTDFPPIGTWVRFHKRVVVQQKSQENGWSRDFEAIECGEDVLSAYHKHFERKGEPARHCGQIVGATYLRRGVTDGGGYDDPLYFTSVGKSCFVYLVSIGFINKPLWVLPEDAEILDPDDVELVLHMPYSYFYMSDEFRVRLSQEMKKECAEVPFARDEKGRFCSVLPPKRLTS